MNAYTACRGFVQNVWSAIDALALDNQKQIADDRRLNPHASRVPIDNLVAALDALQCAHKTQSIGIAIGSRLPPSCFNLLGHLVLSSQTLKQALEYLECYHKLVLSHGEIYVRQDRHQTTLSWEPNVSAARPILIEMVFAAIWKFGVWATGQSAAFTRIEFNYKQPDYHQELELLFGCPIQYDMPRNAIVFPCAWLHLSMLSCNQGVSQLLLANADEALLTLTKTDSVLVKLRSWLQQVDEITTLSLSKLAHQLHMSERTLQRRLSACDTSFKKELVGEKLRRSRFLVKRSDRSLCDIAHALGYSEQSSFSHAYKKWFGISPQDDRNALSLSSLNNTEF